MPKQQSTAASSQQPAASSQQPAASPSHGAVACEWAVLLKYLQGLGSGADHEDDVQDTMVALHRCWGAVPQLDAEQARRYAATALRNRRAYRVLRMRPRQHQLLGDAVFSLVAWPPNGAIPLSPADNLVAFGMLGCRAFEVLSARMEGWAVGRIAENLGTSRSAVLRVVQRYLDRAEHIVEKSAEFGPDGTREALCLVRRQMLAEIEP